MDPTDGQRSVDSHNSVTFADNDDRGSFDNDFHVDIESHCGDDRRRPTGRRGLTTAVYATDDRDAGGVPAEGGVR